MNQMLIEPFSYFYIYYHLLFFYFVSNFLTKNL